MSSSANIQTVTFDGKRFVILPEAEFERIVGVSSPGAKGTKPAVAAMRAVMARDIVRDRKKVGWTQAELARRAGIRVETLNRIETGKHTPSVATIEKIDDALRKASKKKRAKKK